MDGNPYAAFVAMMDARGDGTNPAGDSARVGLGAAPARMRLGEVINTAPLTVRVAGFNQPPSALRINERLVKGARWHTKITSPDSNYNGLAGDVEGPVTTPHGLGSLIEVTDGNLHSTDTTIDHATVEQLELDLEVGDTVLLLTEDDQLFYIVMKVVDAV